MRNNNYINNSSEEKSVKTSSEKGAALVMALFILLLLMSFVAFAISRTSTETLITNNDISESKAYAASQAALEDTTRDFVDLFENKLAPNGSDIKKIKSKKVQGFENYSFAKTINETKTSENIILTGGNYSGLSAIRDSWELDATAIDKRTDVKVSVKRNFYSDRIPLFQFGAFYEDDLELNRPAPMLMKGRVHTNNNLFINGSVLGDINLESKVTAVGEIVNDIWKTGRSLYPEIDDQGRVFIKDSAGNMNELLTGEASVDCRTPNGENVFASSPNLPFCSSNPLWEASKAKFHGNLENHASQLTLPISRTDRKLSELVKRGQNVGDMANIEGSLVAVTDDTKDDEIVARERYSNKSGIRISLADSQNKLPGCAAVTSLTDCGVRLDGTLGKSIGYQPLTMSDGYKATALNATRMAIDGREIWIKIETVSYTIDDLVPQVKDITQDILSLGVTERAPIGRDLKIYGYSSKTDSRSIIKLQRFAIEGMALSNTDSTSYISNYTIGRKSQNLVVRYSDVSKAPDSNCGDCTPQDEFARPSDRASSQANSTAENAGHLKWASINSSEKSYAIVPFPIQMFDSREGLPNDDYSESFEKFGTEYVPAAGTMSLIDIDVANFKWFLNGRLNGKFPNNTPFARSKGSSLTNKDIPENSGWVIYVSDRRGDYDFDGIYDMEDIFPNGSLSFNEDVNENGVLDTDYEDEAVKYSVAIPKGQAATSDHPYYRRGVRLINGKVLPGKYDSRKRGLTKGFTIASENGVYVKGNYNATGVSLLADGGITPAENYLPQNTKTHIPASIVADAITILSNSWKDANAFEKPFTIDDRIASDTQIRFALIAGDPITGSHTNPYKPGFFGQLNGGIINLVRFLENWRGKRLNYSGSLINLYNAQINNSFFKCCDTVYVPPNRDWIFDESFLIAERLPPGTPYIFSISFTGFQRVNE